MRQAFNKISAMSFAEILVTLSIIGIISGVMIPTVVSRVGDKAIGTQKKATVAVISEAIGRMTNINGYGGGDSTKAAHMFLTAGLQKSLKIRTICTKDNLKSCGLPASFRTAASGSSSMSFPQNMKELFPSTEGIDSDVAGFATINGVSVAVYYNPDCSKRVKYWDETDELNIKDKICVNMIYDVNGTQPPNVIGRDMGYITVLYSDLPEITSSEIAELNNSTGKIDDLCRTIDKAHVPNLEELASLYVNKNINGMNAVTGKMISSTLADKKNLIGINFSDGDIYTDKADKQGATRCIKDANKND